MQRFIRLLLEGKKMLGSQAKEHDTTAVPTADTALVWDRGQGLIDYLGFW
jgi:hypothetical protein